MPIKKRHSYKEFRLAWRVLVASAVGVVCGATMLPFNTLGAVIWPLSAETGWGRGDIQLCYFIFAVSSALVYPWIGVLVDRYGARLVVLIGLPCFSLSFAAISLSGDSLIVFYTAWALVGILGAGTAPITFTRAVNAWFVENRGLALAITLFFGGIASAIFQIASTFFVEHYGWRWAFIGLALVPVLIALPLAYVYFHEPGQGEGMELQKKQPKSAISDSGWKVSVYDYRFWMLGIAVLVITFSISGIMLNIKPLLHDKGMSPQSAAYVAATVGITVSIARLLTGYLIDRFWAPGIAFPLLVLPVISCVLLAQENISFFSAIIAGMFIGVATGAETDLIAYLTVRYFGLQNYGKLYGILFSVFILASGVAPYIFGFVFDYMGDYQIVLWSSAVFFILGASLILGMGRYPNMK